MTAFTARTSDGTYGLTIAKRAMNDIDRLCCAAGNAETGGILIGRYTADRLTAMVIEATPPPPDSRSGHTWFVRGVAGLCDLLLQRWNLQDPKYYVGEWHFHPATSVEPSGEDLYQMMRIASTKQYLCSAPLLLIIGRPAADSDSRPMRTFVFPAGESADELHPQCDRD